MTTATEATTRTLEVPGATLTYDVRPGRSDDAPLFLIGSPMAAADDVCTTRFTPSAAAARMTFAEPFTFVSSMWRGLRAHVALTPATWNTVVHSAAAERSEAPSSTSPRTGVAPSSLTSLAAASLRASARTLRPSATRPSTTPRPTKPLPPVTRTGSDGTTTGRA